MQNVIAIERTGKIWNEKELSLLLELASILGGGQASDSAEDP